MYAGLRAVSSGLRLRRPVFLPPDSAVLSVFVASPFASPFAPPIVHRPPFVGRRPLSIPCRGLFIARRCAASLPFGPDHGFCIRGIPACMSAGAACRVVPQRFRRSAFPRKSLRLPQLGRRAVSDKITPCVLLSGAIFPARSAILLTIWQRLPFGTTFVQIQDVTGAPDPQGGRTPAARTENGKNINN